MPHCAPTACKCMVSGSISLPSTGFFSFFSRPTWFTIGRRVILSLRRWSSQIHTGFHVSGATWVVDRECSGFRVQDFHLLWPRHSFRVLLAFAFLTLAAYPTTQSRLPLPRLHNAQGLDMQSVWADPFSLAATKGVAFCFLFLGLLRCFNSPCSPLHLIYSDEDTKVVLWWVAPFGYPRITAC